MLNRLVILICLGCCINPIDAAARSCFSTEQYADTTQSATSYWRMIDVENNGERCKYVGGKRVFIFKEIFAVIEHQGHQRLSLLCTEYDIYKTDYWEDEGWNTKIDSVKLKYYTKEITLKNRQHIIHLAYNKIKIYLPQFYPIVDTYIFERTTLQDIKEWERKEVCYNKTSQNINSEYLQRLYNHPQYLKGKVRIDPLGLIQFNDLLEAVIQENGLDRELALKCYYMNIQRDMSFHPKISNAVAYPPLHPIATMRAEQIEAKPSLRKSRNR